MTGRKVGKNSQQIASGYGRRNGNKPGQSRDKGSGNGFLFLTQQGAGLVSGPAQGAT